MNRMFKVAVTAAVFALTGLALAKLPPPTDAEKAKSEEAKGKAVEGQKKEAEQLAKAQDRAAEHYLKDAKSKGNALHPMIAKFLLFDTDKDGCIDRKEAQSAPELMANFRSIDANGDGKLCADELRSMTASNVKQVAAPKKK
jgi:hypothetical protein